MCISISTSSNIAIHILIFYILMYFEAGYLLKVISRNIKKYTTPFFKKESPFDVISVTTSSCAIISITYGKSF